MNSKTLFTIVFVLGAMFGAGGTILFAVALSNVGIEQTRQ
jgi:hypothetical protein